MWYLLASGECWWRCVGVGSKLLLQTSTLDDDDASAIDDMKARRIHNVLEQIRSRGVHDVGSDRRSMLDELHSFANTLNGLDLPSVAATSSQQHRHEQPYSDRLAQTRADLKALEQIISDTFHWQPQQSSVYDSTVSDVVDQHSVILHTLLFFFTNTKLVFLFLASLCTFGWHGSKVFSLNYLVFTLNLETILAFYFVFSTILSIMTRFLYRVWNVNCFVSRLLDSCYFLCMCVYSSGNHQA